MPVPVPEKSSYGTARHHVLVHAGGWEAAPLRRKRGAIAIQQRTSWGALFQGSKEKGAGTGTGTFTGLAQFRDRP